MAALGIALSLPSTIFGIALLSFWMVDKGFISRTVGIILFLFVIISTFGLLIWHGINKKD
jgi:hypothetical protein